MADDTAPPASSVTTSKTVRTGPKRSRTPIVQVDVTVNFPPLMMAPPPAPAAPAPAPDPTPDPAPIQSPPAPAPAPVVVSTSVVDTDEPTLPWYRPSHLWWYFKHGFHVVSDALDYFWKKWHFWLWTAMLSLPDLYDMAVSQHYIQSAMVPPLLTKIISSVAFFGAASQMIKKKESASS